MKEIKKIMIIGIVSAIILAVLIHITLHLLIDNYNTWKKKQRIENAKEMINPTEGSKEWLQKFTDSIEEIKFSAKTNYYLRAEKEKGEIGLAIIHYFRGIDSCRNLTKEEWKLLHLVDDNLHPRTITYDAMGYYHLPSTISFLEGFKSKDPNPLDTEPLLDVWEQDVKKYKH